jgi:DNA-directed RNA polymerase subunit RPC12/RpoP
MQKQEHICLACGNYYVTAPRAVESSDKEQCPKCSSSNTIKLDASRIFGMFSGGG